jgi:hypothetical protein
MGQFMSQHGHVSMTSIGEKYVIAEGDRTISTGPKHQATQPAGHARAPDFVDPYPGTIHLKRNQFHYCSFGFFQAPPPGPIYRSCHTVLVRQLYSAKNSPSGASDSM